MKEAKISNYVLIGISAISIVILGLFMFVGFDTPYEDNPSFKDPQFTNLLLDWNYILIAVTVLLSVWSVVMQVMKGKSALAEPGLAGKTDVISIVFLVISIIAGVIYGMGDTEMLTINNKAWNPVDAENSTNNMVTVISIVSIIILSVVTVIATLASMVATMLKK